MKETKLDELFQQHQGDFERKPSDAAWSRLEHLLDEHEQPNKGKSPRKMTPWKWWIVGSAVAALLCAGIFLPQLLNNTKNGNAVLADHSAEKSARINPNADLKQTSKDSAANYRGWTSTDVDGLADKNETSELATTEGKKMDPAFFNFIVHDSTDDGSTLANVDFSSTEFKAVDPQAALALNDLSNANEEAYRMNNLEVEVVEDYYAFDVAPKNTPVLSADEDLDFAAAPTPSDEDFPGEPDAIDELILETERLDVSDQSFASDEEEKESLVIGAVIEDEEELESKSYPNLRDRNGLDQESENSNVELDGIYNDKDYEAPEIVEEEIISLEEDIEERIQLPSVQGDYEFSDVDIVLQEDQTNLEQVVISGASTTAKSTDSAPSAYHIESEEVIARSDKKAKRQRKKEERAKDYKESAPIMDVEDSIQPEINWESMLANQSMPTTAAIEWTYTLWQFEDRTLAVTRVSPREIALNFSLESKQAQESNSGGAAMAVIETWTIDEMDGLLVLKKEATSTQQDMNGGMVMAEYHAAVPDGYIADYSFTKDLIFYSNSTGDDSFVRFRQMGNGDLRIEEQGINELLLIGKKKN